MRVAIIGGGIGGLSLAVALSLKGHSYDVYEQAGKLSDVGAGLQLAPSAVRLLQRAGLRAQLTGQAVQAEASELRRWDDNRLLSRTELGQDCQRRYGAPYYLILRAELHRALVERAGRQNIQLGHRLIGIEQAEQQVSLRFDNGARRVADVVIGADGIHSTVRAYLARDSPVFSGHSIYRKLVAGAELSDAPNARRVTVWLGPGRHCVRYPVSETGMVSFAATCPSDDRSAESWTTVGDATELSEAYAGWNDEARALISAPGAIGRWVLHDRPLLRRWSSGRLTLLGDAAHPMLPFMAQGANQAIEDAFALAGCLSRASTAHIPAALRLYEALRRSRTAAIQQGSRDSNRMLHLPDGELQQSRDADMTGKLSDRDWLWSYDAEAAVRGTDLQAALQGGDSRGVEPVTSL